MKHLIGLIFMTIALVLSGHGQATGAAAPRACLGAAAVVACVDPAIAPRPGHDCNAAFVAVMPVSLRVDAPMTDRVASLSDDTGVRSPARPAGVWRPPR